MLRSWEYALKHRPNSTTTANIHNQATGSVGKYITDYLMKNGKHNITAVTRFQSKSKIPEGVHAAKVDYDSEQSLVDGLKGHDFLIITMSTLAPRDTQTKLINAAAKAGIKWIMPNEFSPMFGDDEALGKSIGFYDRAASTRKQIEDLGMNWTSLVCGFWYEFSLAGSPARYGFDLGNKKLTLFDDGETKINTSTWPQCGRAVANLLGLKIFPQDETDKSPTLSQFMNKPLCISSFLVSQKDMLASVLRVTGSKESEWSITSEPAEARFEEAINMTKSGNRTAFQVSMYTRVFFKDGRGDYEKDGRLANEALSLPRENLDEFTRIAVMMAESGEAAYH